MSWESKISDKNITIKKNTLNISKSIEEANSSSFSFQNDTYDEFVSTQPVEIKKDTKLQFKGYISNINQSLRYGGVLTSDVDCQGQDYLLKKRIIEKAFKNTKISEIIKYMVDNILTEEGISIGEINADTVIERIAFNSITCYAALDQLIMFGDYIWNITDDKKINFIKIGDNKAPYDLDFTSEDCIAIGGEYQLEQDLSNYTNTVILKGVKGLTPRTEYFKGDGSGRDWTTKMNIYNINELYVDYNDGNGYVAETFAPNAEKYNNGQYKFLYSKNSNQLQQYEDQDDASKTPPLTSDNVIKLVYNGCYDISFKYNNIEEIEKQKKVDFTSGVNEIVEEVEIYGISNALQYAKSVINKNKKKGYRLSFKTDKEGFKPLQTIRVVIPQLKIDNDFLITSVATVEEDIILYEISIVDGDLRENYLTELFGNKEQFKSDLMTDDSIETVNRSLTFEKTWTSTETPNIFSSSLFPSNSLFPSDTLFPSLPTYDRLKFLQLYYTDDNIKKPFLRVPVIGDEVLDNGNTYISTALIDEDISFDKKVSHIAWIASNGLTNPKKDDFTSGDIICEADVDLPFNKVEDLETITILRIDKKWEEV